MIQLLSKIGEMIDYDGYTYDEVCEAAGGGGGGKGGGQQQQTPDPIQTTTSIGNQLTNTDATFEAGDEEKKRAGVDKKKLGTRGLQIPLATPKSNTAATTGVQL